MRRMLVKIALAAAALGAAGAAHGQALVARTGNVVAVFADPSDVVIELDVRGPCGSFFYHVQRSAINFREMTEVALAALSANKRLLLYAYDSCGGPIPDRRTDRNRVSHGAVLR